MPSILETAVAYAAAGLPIIPLLGPLEGSAHQAGKQPRLRAWQTEQLSVLSLQGWWARWPQSNVGLVTGVRSGLICIDVDPRNGGTAWFTEYRDGLRALGCGVERTGSGGWHLWFAHPGTGLRIQSRRGKEGIAPGVELLADGGHQAVIAPSVHRLGGVYTWFDGPQLPDLRDFGPVLPDWIIARAGLEDAASTVPRGTRVEAYTDHPDDVARCAAALDAIEPSIEGQGGDTHLVKDVVMLGRDFGLSPEAFWPLLCAFNARCVPPWDEALLRKKLASGYKSARAPHPGQASPVVAFAEPAPAIPPPQEPRAMPAGPPATPEGFRPAWQEGIIRGAKGKWANCVRNLQLVLEHDERVNQCFRYNLFSEAVEIATPPWRGWIGTSEWIDDDGAALSAWLARAFEDHPLFTMPIIHAGVRPFARTHAYHPVRDYLDGLTWDGTPRLSGWLHALCGADASPYHAAVGRRFLIGAVARVRTPGCQMDTSLILEGAQGIGKSRLARALFDPLYDPRSDKPLWFTDAPIDVQNKDSAQTVRGHWGVELGELHVLRRAEQTAIKSYFSRREDRQRDAYDRCTVTHKRQCVFIGTTNTRFNPNDETGGRRFWPVECRRIDLVAAVATRGHLWAEAAAAFAAGEHWHLTAEEEAHAQAARDERAIPDEWLEPIRHFVNDGDFGVSRSGGITGAEIYAGVLQGSVLHMKRMDSLRIAECMKLIGFEPKVFWRNGRSVRGFVRKGA